MNSYVQRNRENNTYGRNVLSFSIRPRLVNELDYAKAKFARYVQDKMQEPDIQDEDFHIVNPFNRAFSFPISFKRSTSFAIAGNIGFPVLGMDMTFKTFRNTFVTLNLSLLSGELIFQQRLLNKNKIGIATGLYVRAQRRWLQVVEAPDETFGLSTIISLLSPARTYHNKTIGLRSVFYIPMDGNAYLHAIVAPGYVTNLEQLTVNIGISLSYDI